MADTTNKQTKPEYILHSRGEEWFHFRIAPESLIESFSVTYCHDGTVFMTGDLGCLTWRRPWFPDRPDYGFPSDESGIGYFAEKVVRSDSEQKIHEWTTDKAMWDMREAMFPDRCVEDIHDSAIGILASTWRRYANLG